MRGKIDKQPSISRSATRLAVALAVLCQALACASEPSVAAPDEALAKTQRVRGQVIDHATGTPIPARVHIQSDNGTWHFAQSSDTNGSAVHYQKAPAHLPGSAEMHTTLSAHPFHVDLAPGSYVIRVERGKEYLPHVQTVEVAGEPVDLTIPLRRWANAAERGWYSGDTHVHRSLAELPNVLLAEDLNVALPLTYWVRESGVAPSQAMASQSSDTPSELIEVDPLHVIYPVNTEYEIFRVGQRQHTLGAVFVLNHKTPLDLPAPPVQPIAAEARRQGAILDLDKHSWPWSLMLVPVMDVDLFELTNNHIWQTQFGFRRWTLDTVPAYFDIERNEDGFTEWGWIEFGLETYYSLLNCGFRMRVSAGTASGVHPVQLGFGRVYVHLPDGFAYDRWIQGLDAGRSFVTTGPLLFVTFNGHAPGQTFSVKAEDDMVVHISGVVRSQRPLESVEIVENGRLRSSLATPNLRTRQFAFENPIDRRIRVKRSSWFAVRCIERQPDRRVRFAHTNPVHIDVEKAPLVPRLRDTRFLVTRMEEEIKRNEGVLESSQLDEYQRALETFRALLDRSR